MSKKVDIRQLMRRQKVQSSLSATKKIDSPLARYNSLGQLSCKLCNIPIKSEILWKSHLQSRKHKESVELLKSGKPLTTPSTASKHATKQKDSEEPVIKKVKVSETSTTEKGLPADFFDTQISSSEVRQPVSTVSTTQSTNPSLPADFFDVEVSSQAETVAEKDVQPDSSSKSMAEALPEGFFDDPNMDAKVRKVEPKKNIEDEWVEFQKVMEQEQKVSEAILEEDVDEAQKERQIDEIDEQMTRWKKADILRDKQEELRAKVSQQTSSTVENEETNDDDNDDEADFEEFLDWRSKEAWK
ncbi:zinc finger protein 830-like [Anneissia japonica]|uniref:zinc finger protein 830-like n=1 Tax=Anneissia japonica TaxID=1529436 RepID=UPI0014255CF3|nr:zinc finger protein 830-like [Anneissia japonica]